METNQWQSKKKTESASETLQGYSKSCRGQARMVPSGNGIRPQRARKSLSDKLESVTLNSPKKDLPLNLYGQEGERDEISLKDEEIGLRSEVSSPFCGVSDKLLQRIELLGRDHETKKLDNNNFKSTETKKERQEDDLIGMKSKIQTLASENSQLKKSLVAKEELVVSLQDRESHVEAEFKAVMSRLDSSEKENAFLRYEYTVLEKDLEVKTEETEYTRRSMELTHKQQLRNVNKIVELEAECKRLRLLFRKKFPEKSLSMRNEDEERRRRSMNKSDLMMRDEVQNRKLKYDLLIEQIGNVRAENKNLMEIIMKKNMEIKDLSRKQKPLEVSSSDIRSESSVISPSSCSKEMMLLMDDFSEMEKLAIVCTTSKDPREDDDDDKERPFDWIQVVLSAITKQKRISKRGVKELLEDIKIALGCMDNDDAEIKKSEGDPLCITWESSVDSGPMTKDEIKRHLRLTKAEKIECDERQELRDKIKEAEETNRNLEEDIKALRESKETVEAELEMEKSMKEDLDTKLNITRANLNETEKKLSSLEVEHDYRKSCCEELEGTCIELQLQLESVEPKKPMQRNKNRWDIAEASVKLSECQETITNLRKQLRALSTTETSRTMKLPHKRSSLRDNIEDSMAKDSSCKAEDDNNKVTRNDDSNHHNALVVYEQVKEKGEKMEMVPRKKQGLGFLKKLLFRRKRVSSKKCLALTMQ